jgi:arginase
VIRDAGIINDLKKLGWQVRDHGDLVFDSSKLGTDNDPPVHVDPRYTTLKNCLTVGSACRQVYDRVLNTARAQELALTLGGDHSLAIGSIAGVADAWGRDDLRVIWVDAHGDINTPATTPTGNLHGMPVAFLMHLIRADQPVPGFEWLYHTGNNKPILTPDRIVFIGLRDVDAGEKVNLKAHGIKCFSMKEIDRWGIGKVMNMAIKHVDPMGRKPIHLSFDVDGIDPLVRCALALSLPCLC